MVYHFGRNTVDIIGDSEGIMHYIVNGLFARKSKLLYKTPGNQFGIRGGLYFIARFPDGTSKRMYLNELVEYR